MAVSQLEARPPFVRFEVRAVEDRNASIEAGHFVGKDVVFALITPRGSKDIHEEIAEDWLKKMEQQLHEQRVDGEERIPATWVEQWRMMLKSFKEGVESPVAGMALRNWPGITPSQLRTCLAVHIHSVEDLAGSNEEAVNAIGMGGRALREKAVKYLEAARGPGATAAQLVAQGEQLKSLMARNEVLERQVQALVQQVSTRPAEAHSGAGSGVSGGVGISDLLSDEAPKLRKL